MADNQLEQATQAVWTQADDAETQVTQAEGAVAALAQQVPTMSGVTVTASPADQLAVTLDTSFSVSDLIPSQIQPITLDSGNQSSEQAIDFTSYFGVPSKTANIQQQLMDVMPNTERQAGLLRQMVTTGYQSGTFSGSLQAQGAQLQLEINRANNNQPNEQQQITSVVKISTDASGATVLGVGSVAQANLLLRDIPGFSGGKVISSDQIGNIAQPNGAYMTGPNPSVNLSAEDLQANAQAAFSGNGGVPVASIVVASPGIIGWVTSYAEASGQEALAENNDVQGNLETAYEEGSEKDNPAEPLKLFAGMVNNAIEAPAYSLQYRYDVYASASGSGAKQVVVTAYGVDSNGKVYAYHPFLSKASQLLNQP
jgi:hypothetical protein